VKGCACDLLLPDVVEFLQRLFSIVIHINARLHKHFVYYLLTVCVLGQVCISLYVHLLTMMTNIMDFFATEALTETYTEQESCAIAKMTARCALYK